LAWPADLVTSTSGRPRPAGSNLDGHHAQARPAGATWDRVELTCCVDVPPVVKCAQMSSVEHPFPSRHQLQHTITRAFRRDPCHRGRVRCRRRADPTMLKNVART
jgi:hypothetical protein